MPHPTLLLIDFQRGFEVTARWGGERSTPRAEARARALLAAWRRAGAPIVHIRHASLDPDSPLAPDAPGFAALEGLDERNGETVLTKRVNSAFIGTDLDGVLRRSGAADLTVAGLTTDHCVSTSVRMAANLGYRVQLVGDACAAFAKRDADGVIPAETVHRVHLASLGGEFARIVTADDAMVALS